MEIATKPRGIDLRHLPASEIPESLPLPKRISAISPLEQALHAENMSLLQSLLRDGADPAQISAIRLRQAVNRGGAAAECARLIAVAKRTDCMRLAKPGALACLQHGATRNDAMVCNPTAQTRLAGWLPNFFSACSEVRVDQPVVGPIARALMHYDLPAARAALKKFNRSPMFFRVKRDEDRLIGMLALNDTASLAAWHQKGLLEQALATVTAPGIKSQLKQFPYTSVKPGRNPLLNLNGKVNFRGTQTKIVCRHLAVHWLLDKPLNEAGKISYRPFQSAENLQKTVARASDALYEHYITHSAEAHLVANDEWGTFLARQFREMEESQGVSAPKRFLLNSENHAMACELKIKLDQDSASVYVVHFYDPNSTGTHRRIRTEDLASIEAISMADLINNRRRTASYYRNQSLTLAFAVSDAMPRPVPNTRKSRGLFVSWNETGRVVSQPEGIMHRTLFSKPTAPHQATSNGSPDINAISGGRVDQNYLYLLLDGRFTGELPNAFAEIAKIPDTKRQFEIFSAAGAMGLSGFALAMQSGYTDTVKAYVRGLLESATLSSGEKTSILSREFPKAGYGSGLWCALGWGRTQTVTAFIEAVIASPALSPAQKRTVLETRNAAGECSLELAKNNFHLNAVNAYKKAIARSALPLA